MKAISENNNKHLAIISLVMVGVVAVVQDWTRSNGVIIAVDMVGWTALYAAFITLTLNWLSSLGYLFIGLLMLAVFFSQGLWEAGLYGMTVNIILGVLVTTSGLSLLTLVVNYLTNK
jgi:hypothetical protein